MKLLVFTTLYPHGEKPSHGIFIETRLRKLLAPGTAQARVVAPVPWFPSAHPLFGTYASYSRIPRREVRHGVDVVRPRYAAIPRFGMTVAPLLLARGARRAVGEALDALECDLISAHYFYPDGVAAAMLAAYFNKPLVISAHGSDINLIADYRLARRQIVWAAQRADAIVTVCDALRRRLVGLGVEQSKLATIRNGVDLELFHPSGRDAAREALGLSGFTLLSVGNLIALKGHALVIGALRQLHDVQLMIAGAGPQRGALEALARRLGVAHRVRFLGLLDQRKLCRYYGAADALVLASSHEGWANVLLESMACGTPVIAGPVGGTPEVVAFRDAGLLYGERSSAGIAAAVTALRMRPPDRQATRRYAEQFSWDETVRRQLRLFEAVAAGRRGAAI